MPAVSRVQQRMAGADLARARAGKPTRTGMTEAQLTDFASTSHKGLPERKGRFGVHGRRKKKHPIMGGSY
jgi:hypothetical protein